MWRVFGLWFHGAVRGDLKMCQPPKMTDIIFAKTNPISKRGWTGKHQGAADQRVNRSVISDSKRVQNAERLYQLPIRVIGIAIGTVLLPEMSRRITAGDDAGAAASQRRAFEFTLLATVPFVACPM
jgi:hypothetical protein